MLQQAEKEIATLGGSPLDGFPFDLDPGWSEGMDPQGLVVLDLYHRFGSGRDLSQVVFYAVKQVVKIEAAVLLFLGKAKQVYGLLALDHQELVGGHLGGQVESALQIGEGSLRITIQVGEVSTMEVGDGQLALEAAGLQPFDGLVEVLLCGEQIPPLDGQRA
jgi:hypothetical protein